MDYTNIMGFVCAKCGSTHCETGKFRATGGGLSKLFDIQTEKFNTITCSKCGYTEIYKSTTDLTENVLDFFIGG